MKLLDWHWNEMQQVGTDYTDLKEVADYDSRMATFRDVDAENRGILDALNLPQKSAIVEIGCGTGRFVRSAAAAGHRVVAVDVSAQMLEYVTLKAGEVGQGNLEVQHAGFMTMDFEDSTFDAAVSNAALHHLPDVWKLMALNNIARILKPGGQLYLGDVVFSLERGESPEACIERFVDSYPQMRDEAARHAAVEFSTYDWIMEGLLARAGFEILSAEKAPEVFIIYHCRKR